VNHHPTADSDRRQQRLLSKVRREVLEEFASAESALRQRADYHPVWDYFLNLLPRLMDPDRLREAVGRPLLEHLCNQAPFELFHAAGVHPVRLGSGCHTVGRLSASRFPVLMCPMLKATAGMMRLDGDRRPPGETPRVVPTTCDWVVKFPEMTSGSSQSCCFIELPHLREGEAAQNRWLEETYRLVRFLETFTGRRLKRKALLASVETFMHAWRALGGLIEHRRRGGLAGVWFAVVANSFMLDPVEVWTDHLLQALETVSDQPSGTAGKTVFLAGSPIIFPNFKLLNLIESAGMSVRADDLCTSERIWPGAVRFEDTSYHGMMRALAERYHRGCICPTFADNERRIHSILHTLRRHPIRGVVHHVLKGCHPFDIESFALEDRLKREGHTFLRIETDYVLEDSQNILTRLEAFGQI
jgi:benzoyl-CoA reductase/2-hydroxyglutaryl-CoA dehydratase subunit BcrC/BadD/HgdB